MGRIFVCGDTHMPIDIKKLNTTNWKEQKNLTKEDVLIQLGDFGGLWYFPENKKYKEDIYWQEWLAKKPFTFCFVDGNHENFELLNKLPIIEKFGGKVGVVKTKKGEIYHLKRGETYNINGKTIFAVGGASSNDKLYRTENIDWWKEELPNYQEMNNIIDNANKIEKVDFIVSHTCPKTVANILLQKKSSKMYGDSNFERYFNKSKEPMTEFLEEIFNILKNKGLKEWHFGHWHFVDNINIDNTKFYLHYNNSPMELK